MIMNEAKEQSELVKPTNFNIDVILDIMNNSQKDTLQVIITQQKIFQNCKKQILANLDEIEKSLIGYYNSICEQIKLKNSNPKAEVSNAFQSISQAKNTQQLKVWVKKLVAMIPSKQKQTETSVDMSQQQLIDTLKSCNQEINTMISSNVSEVNKKLKQYQKNLEESVNKTNIWKKNPKFKFSPILKHADIKLITDFHIKSQNTSGYKFAIMEPSLQKGSDNKTFHFKIKECSSNWIAIGMCHKNVVVSKGYTFNFSTLGHGGYMISANGGTWSNNNAEFNNKVKAFKFAKGDVVTAVVNMEQKIITFKKKQQSFDIPFSTIAGDELHPCALFYYVNDEVEYLPDYKP